MWVNGQSDPYCWATINGVEVARTRTLSDSLNPEWNEEFTIELTGEHQELFLEVFDDDPGKGDDLLGRAIITLGALKSGETRKTTVPLIAKYDLKKNSTITYETTFHGCDTWDINTGSFPLRHQNRVTLYQGAHVDDSDCPPPIFQASADAEPYSPEACWEEIYRKILFAKRFVFITGWSVDTNISLLRRRPIFRGDESSWAPLEYKSIEIEVEHKVPTVLKKAKEAKEKWEEKKKERKERKEKVKKVLEMLRGKDGMLTTGELLKRKAQEGVCVVLQLWNEATSVSMNGRAITNGLMGTHDEETFNYFQGSGVHCRLSYRDADDWGGSYIWTHHQKSVILDDEVAGNPDKRRIIAFVGGLDLTDGRWDTPEKSLFRSLATEHAGDFHQVWPGIVSSCGPRQPWQDIHSKLEGPVARDVLQNFAERLKKQHPDLEPLLVDPENTDSQTFLSASEDVYNDAKSWDVQLLRSIDSTSCIRPGVEKSIQEAYINAIRRAQRFIYIENQYFMGSSKYWSEPIEGSSNRVPIELALKIEAMIRLGKRFTVFLVIPMYPEGVPGDGAVQEMLYWQSRTVEMIYKRIAAVLHEMSSTAKLQDYFCVFCLGARETKKGSEGAHSSKDIPDDVKELDFIGNQSLLADTRRFQVYVHSKLMIVDDEYVILGSANINERSMAGDRDTEIAIGAYQPHQPTPYGAVHNFRMSLWAEHLGYSDASLLHPEQSVAAILAHAEKNWRIYSGEKVRNLRGHLMLYPYQIAPNGTLTAQPEKFPDAGGLILGQTGWKIPDKLTM